MTNPNPIRNGRSSLLLHSNINSELRMIRLSVPRKSHVHGRFEFYDYLYAVYKIYRRWKRRAVALKTSRKIARALHVPMRKGVSPIRILIEATFSQADRRQKSRWVRALQHAHDEHITPEKLTSFIRSNGGIAGCAARAALDDPKKWTDRDDWA